VKFELPPSGTRGSEVPKAVRPLLRVMSGVGNVPFRLGLKIQVVRPFDDSGRRREGQETILARFPTRTGLTHG
jgi:hypothetical protein